MRAPSLRSICTFLTILATTDAAAQSSLRARPLEDTVVRYAGTYRMREGRLDRSPALERAGTRVLYNCTTPGRYYSFVGNSFATNGNHEWIDEGRLFDTTRLDVDQIDGFDFSYCSSDLDTSGNSGSMLVSFYDDHAPCSTTSVATCSYPLGGLPLSTTGNVACWAVSVDLEGGFECSTNTAGMFRTMGHAGKTDPHFGWGLIANPGLSSSNDTGPVLDLPCATPFSLCSGSGSLQGNVNRFVWNDPIGYWTGCYWFTGLPWASFSMKMFGPETGALSYGQSSNTLDLSATAFNPGSSITFTTAGAAAGNSLFLLLSGASGSMVLPAGEIVTSTSLLYCAPQPITSAVTTMMPISMPDPTYAQVVETTGPASVSTIVALSNGLALHDSLGGPGTGGGCGGTMWLTSTPLCAGQTGTLTVTGATPGASVAFLCSGSGGGPTTTNYGGCTGITLCIGAPFITMGTEIANAAGIAQFAKKVPANAGGQQFWYHAVDLSNCDTSNGISQVIH